MWVVTTKNETLNIINATSLQSTVKFVQKAIGGGDYLDTNVLEKATVTATIPGATWGVVLAELQASLEDTKEALNAKAHLYVAELRLCLAEGKPLCDLHEVYLKHKHHEVTSREIPVPTLSATSMIVDGKPTIRLDIG